MAGARTAILRNLTTTLQAIVAGGTLPSFPNFGPVLFKSTVKSVVKVDRAWTPSQIPPDSTPMIVIQPQLDTPVARPGGIYDCDWQCILMVFVEGYADDIESRIDLIDSIEDDIWAALNADTTRGGNAVETKMLPIDPEYLAGAPMGALRMLIEFRYYRSVASS